MKKETRDLFERILAAALVVVMVLTCVFVSDGITSYAKTTNAANVSKLSVSSKFNYAYEGQKFNESAFRSSTTVKVTKGKKTQVVKNYKVSAPAYVKANGSGKNKGRLVVRVTYGGKSVSKVVSIRKISKIYVKKSSVKSVENGSAFNAVSYKKNTAVYARYKTGSSYKDMKLPTYTVSAAKKVSTKKATRKGYFSVKVTYGKHTTTQYIPVFVGIRVKSSSKALNEGDRFDAASFKKTVTAAKAYASGKTEKIAAGSFKLVNCPSTVKANSASHPGYMGLKVQSANKAAFAYVKVNPLTKIAVTGNKMTAIKKGTTFSEKDFRSKVVVRAYYKTTSANKNITGYTVSVPSKTVTPDKNGKYVVTVKYAGKTAMVAIPVADDKPQPTVSKITVSSTIPYLDNEKVVDDKLKAQIKDSLTVRVTMSDGSTKILDSDAYKLKVISSVTSYSGEGGGFRVDVEYGNNYGKCYIPVLHGIYAESTFDGTFTEGATFDKSAFKKTLSVYNLFVDADWEACTDYKIEAPDTVRVNGTGDHAGRFVITITSGQWSYELAYQVVKGGTADPGDSEVGGQEVDWLYYYGVFASVSELPMITVRAAVNVPSDYGTLTEWGLMCLHSDNIDITKNPEKARTLLGPINNNSGSEPFLDQINDDEWSALKTAQYRICAIVEKDGVSTTYYSKVLHVDKSTGNYYFSK